METCEEKVKCVVIGNCDAGRTNLVNVFLGKDFERIWSPTVLSTDCKNLTIDKRNINVEIWDVASQVEYERLRHSAIQIADVVLIAYSVVASNEDRFKAEDALVSESMTEVKQLFGMKLPPVILVGTKTDLRDKGSLERSLKKDYYHGVKLKTKIRAQRYVECSALADVQSCNQVLEAAVREALKYKAHCQAPLELSSNSFSLPCFIGDGQDQDTSR